MRLRTAKIARTRGSTSRPRRKMVSDDTEGLAATAVRTSGSKSSASAARRHGDVLGSAASRSRWAYPVCSSVRVISHDDRTRCSARSLDHRLNLGLRLTLNRTVITGDPWECDRVGFPPSALTSPWLWCEATRVPPGNGSVGFSQRRRARSFSPQALRPGRHETAWPPRWRRLLSAPSPQLITQAAPLPVARASRTSKRGEEVTP
jgi:hypothetical protein